MKTFKKSILYGMVATILLLGLSVGGFAREYVDIPAAAMYPEKQMAFDWLDQPRIIEKYGKMSDAIWSYAELGMQEFKTSKLVADDLEKTGFKVQRGAAGMPTCFVATYGSGKPVVGFMGELDALPMLSQKFLPYQDPLVPGAPGHGCGHNQQAPTAAVAAIAVKQVMDRYGLKGTIKVYGSPAEETLIGRAYMVPAGIFDGVDAVMGNHGRNSFGGGSLGGISGGCAMFSTEYSFRGVTAHSAGGPWNAKSALDAVDIMNVATNFLREHLHYGYRMHYVIPSGGEAPNVVPDYAKVWYFERNSDERLLSMHEKVVNCAKAAALATGTELTIRVLTAIHQSVRNAAFTELCQSNIELVGMPKWSDEEVAFAKELQRNLGKPEIGRRTEVSKCYKWEPTTFTGGGSNDVAELTRITAYQSIGIPATIPGDIGHHWSRTAGNVGSANWKGITACAKAMAGTALDLLTKPEALKKVRDNVAANIKEYGEWKSYLPEGHPPPNDLNAELMEKWRPKMEPTYLQP
jgi:aminobenzoyl-glutamate utilization protein B